MSGYLVPDTRKMKEEIFERPPEITVEYIDPVEGFRGWLVLDDLSHRINAGGFRVQKGLTHERIAELARNMTLKMQIAGIRCGGAKCGIDYEPAAPGKADAMYRFMRAIKPYILERYSMGPDMNTRLDELDDIAAQLEIPCVKVAIAAAQGLGMPAFMERYNVLREHIYDGSVGRLRSGQGLASACLATLEFLGIPPNRATAVIQGFGGLGGSAALCLHAAGVKIIGIADREKALLGGNGETLDLETLFAGSRGGIIPIARDLGRYTDRGAIWQVGCDIFIPAAVEYAITRHEALMMDTKAVVCGANLAISREAEALLHEKGVIVVPDFVAGCGGSVSMDGLFGPTVAPSGKDVLGYVDAKMRAIVMQVLSRSRERGIAVRQAAMEICSSVRTISGERPYGPLGGSSAQGDEYP